MADLGTAFVRVRGDLSQLNAQLVSTLAPGKLNRLAKGAGIAVGAGLAAGFAGKKLFDIGEDFDNAFDTIRTGTGATGKQLRALQGDFKNILKTLPVGMEDTAAAVTGLNQRLGLTGEPLQKLSRQILQLSKITGTDVKTNVAAVSRLFGDWSVTTDQQEGALNRLFRTAQRTGTNVTDLSQLLVKFGAPLRSLGFNLDESAALLGKWEKEGVNLQTTLPGLRMGLRNIIQPSGKAADALEQLGVKTRDPQKALPQIIDGLRGMKDEGKASALAMQIFGTRAGPDMARAILEGRFEIDNLTESVRKGGDTIKDAEEDTRDFDEQWQLLKNRVFVAIEPIASKFFETIGDGMEALATADFSKIGDNLSKIGDDIGLGDIDIGTIDVSGLEEDASRLRNALTGIAETAGSVFGPIVRTALPGLVQGFKGSFQVLGGVVRVFTSLLTLDFGRAWDGVKQIFKGAGNVLVGTMRAVTAPFRVAVKSLAGALKGPFEDAWGSIKGVFRTGVNVIGTVLRTATAPQRAAARALGQGIVKGFDVVRDIPGIIRRVIGRVPDVIRGAIRAVAGAGEAVGRAITRGISRGIGEVGDFGKALANSVIGLLNDAIPNKIPVPLAPDIDLPDNPIPRLARGGYVRQPLAIVGEEGPELVRLPIGSRVFSHQRSKQMMDHLRPPARIKRRRKDQDVTASGGGGLISSAWGGLRERLPRDVPVSKPAISITDEPEGTYPKGYPRATRGQVWLPRWWLGILRGTSGVPELQNWARSGLVHELVHGVQSFDTHKSRAAAEGGAVLFGEKHQRAINGSTWRAFGQYRAWANQMKKRGSEWINEGQFKPDPEPKKGGRIGATPPKRGQPDREAKKPRTGKVPYESAKAGAARIPGGMVARANKLDRLKLPYKLGGGHGNVARALAGGGFDCSGAVSYVLGIPARTSGQFGSWGKPGPGEVAAYFNPAHMVMSLGSRLFGTGDGTGPHWLAGGPEARFSAPFRTRHIGKAGGRGSFGKPDKKDEKPKAKLRHKGRFSLGQMVSLAKRAGFPDPALAAAIGYAESKGNSSAHNTDGEDSRGLWQINVAPDANPKYKDWDLSDAYRNVKAAYEVSRGGKNWKPWTMYKNGQYKTYLGGRAAPLPKSRQTGTPSGSRYADVLALKIDEAGDTKTLKDDRRWINRALRYWRGVYKRNKANNPQRALEARGQIKDLREQRKNLKTPIDDENLFKLDDLPYIGTPPNAFNIGGFQPAIDRLNLRKAEAELTQPADSDDRPQAIGESLQDDIKVAEDLRDFWQGLYTLTKGFDISRIAPGSPPVGTAANPFDPTPEQTKQLSRTKSQAERIALLKKMIDDANRIHIVGTIKQQIEAAGELATAKEAVKSLKDEAKVPGAETAEAATETEKKQDFQNFLINISELLKGYGSNIAFKGQLQSFQGGGIIQGPKGKPVKIEAHGGEIIFDPNTRNLTFIVKRDEEKAKEQKDINFSPTIHYATPRPDPHNLTRSLLFQLESAV